ncbi:MAG: hypothetical protein KC591_17900 [Gemmatimonadetes bacterium]|nr:hypothetical protein [Gemmatimonadota bacterium]
MSQPLALAVSLLLLLMPAVGHALEVVGPREVLDHWCVERDGGLWLTVDGRSFELVTDPHAPFLSPLGDGEFHPMDLLEVERALATVSVPNDRVRVFVLPYPQRQTLRSNCLGTDVYLAPGLREVPAQHVWTTVVHEIGHVWQHARFPEGSRAWDEYFTIRGLDPARFHATAAHADRPREIFAEDYRLLLGQGLAVANDNPENSEIPRPADVPGLRDWFEANVAPAGVAGEPTFSPQVSPNPFRLAAGSAVDIRFAGTVATGSVTIVDLTGRRVRSLRAIEEGDTTVARWDGRDEAGRVVAPGVYFARAASASPAGRSARIVILR